MLTFADKIIRKRILQALLLKPVENNFCFVYNFCIKILYNCESAYKQSTDRLIVSSKFSKVVGSFIVITVVFKTDQLERLYILRCKCILYQFILLEMSCIWPTSTVYYVKLINTFLLNVRKGFCELRKHYKQIKNHINLILNYKIY